MRFFFTVFRVNERNRDVSTVTVDSWGVFEQRTRQGGSYPAPALKGISVVVQEGAVALPSHFREHTRGSCIVDGESHSVPDDRKGSRGSGEAHLGCEVRGIRGIGRSRTKVLNFAHGCPSDVERRRRVVRSWSTDKGVVDCALFSQMEARRPIAHK